MKMVVGGNQTLHESEIIYACILYHHNYCNNHCNSYYNVAVFQINVVQQFMLPREAMIMHIMCSYVHDIMAIESIANQHIQVKHIIRFPTCST